jgi:hypothetical protein
VSSSLRFVTRSSTIRWIVLTGSLTGFCLVALSIWAWAKFGSVTAALAYFGGHRILAEAYSKSFGTIEPGFERTVSFEITNTTERPVNVVGVTSSCTCLRAVDLPILLAPRGGKQSIRFRYRAGLKPRQVLEKLRIFTDHPSHRWLDVTITGVVAGQGASSSRSVTSRSGVSSGLDYENRFSRDTWSTRCRQANEHLLLRGSAEAKDPTSSRQHDQSTCQPLPEVVALLQSPATVRKAGSLT